VSPDGSTVYAVGSIYDGAITPEALDSDGQPIGPVADYHGEGSTPGPIVFSTKNGVTAYAYVSRIYYVYDDSSGLNVSNSAIAVVRVPGVSAQVQKVLPSRGVETGGTQVSISGSYLTGTTSVLFGNVPGTDVKVVSDSEVAVSTPAKSVGQTDVTVVNPGGNATLANGFTYTTGYGTGAGK
jgi:hypothetical protein